jgi:predicted Zn-ribbon and HTH transcriptional regulator
MIPSQHSDENTLEEQRHHVLERIKKFGPLKTVLMCRNCGILCFVREKEDIPVRCGFCLTTGIPPKFWVEIQVKELVQAP